MHLKRLELYGFKTFSKKTDIEFPHGFLAVVGPNGSGKSNLTDAIRFCLGESNVKALRATRLDELVFAGTPTRRPAPYAEVTAVFDNSDQTLPVELSEVSITRRLERDGGSKFMLNGTVCRLKDIHELLMGSGIGPGSFSVLGGKEVDQVLSTDPKERRMMLEETAGVNRYRFRKREAERRLARTETNLTRLRDILKEVEDQLVESRRQLQRYERYKKGQTELRALDRQVARHEWQELQQKRGALQEKAARLEGELEKARQTESRLRQEMEGLRAEKERLDQLREERSADIAQAREEAGAARAAYESLFRRASELEHTARAALARVEATGERIETQQARVEELKARQPQALQEVETAQAQLDGVNRQLEEVPAPGQGPNAEIRARLAGLEKELNDLVNRLSGLEARTETDAARLEESSQQLASMEAELSAIAPAAIDTEAVRRRLEEAEAGLAEVKEQGRSSSAALEELAGQRKALEQQRRPAVGQVAELEALLEDRSGLPPAVRAVMGWKDPGTVGLIGELIKVPEGLEQAFEAALGGHMNDIVTRDRRVASQLIDRLKRERIGRVTFWPLDLSRRPPKPPELPDRRGVVGRALELLEYPREIEPVLQEILGRTVIMEELQVALALYDRCFGRRPHLVTRTGEYLSPSGALTGGDRRHSHAGLLARRRKLDEAREKLAQVEAGLAELGAREEELRTRRAAGEQALAAAREAVHLARQELSEQEAQEKRRQADMERATSRRDRLAGEMDALKERRERMLAEAGELRQRREVLEADKRHLQEELARNQEEESRLNALRTRLQQEQLEARLGLERRRQQLEELRKEEERERLRQEELRSDQRQAEQEEKRCLEARVALEKEGEELQQRMVELEEALKVKNEELENVRREGSAVDKRSREKSQAFDEASNERQGWSSRLANLQVEIAGVAAHAEEAEARLAAYASEEEADPEEEASHEEILDAEGLARARTRISRLKAFLENFGGVNLGAREDHQRLTERHEHLHAQIQDLTDGADSLRSIMAELDKATVTRFEEIFHRVNDTFSRLFTELFGGGQARLELCNPDDLLESGVEIVACPPGKKLQNMTLLSSGERALSAIAFLLSLLATKPSPIVVLDELDAPLDERNVEKVATRLLEFSTSSQFLVITHNRKTMEFADRLYGVTMEEPGISKTLVVQLQDAEKELGIITK